MNVVFDYNIEYLLAFIPAILGMSLPIMLQVIERIDQNYKSSRLSERLKSEPIISVCKWSLVAALLACAYTIFFQAESLIDCWLLNNSANLIALVCCLSLVASFLWSCSVVLDYYNPEKLQDKIIKAIKSSRNNESAHQRALLDFVDLSKTILEVSDREPAFRIYDIFSEEIGAIVECASENGMVIPNYLAYSITSINENLCMMRRRPYSINNGNQLLKMLISNPTKLSEDSYQFLWKNLLLQLHYEKDEWVYEYWTAAVQTYDFDLHQIYMGMYGVEGDGQYTQDDVNRRLAQRQRYLEFHVVLGAYIMHLKRYDLLDRLFVYTREMPPKYPLVPSSLAEILSIFVQLDDSPRFDLSGEQCYFFPGMKGLVNDEIKGLVQRYLSLLYLRMFSGAAVLPDVSLAFPHELRPLKALDSYMDYLLWGIARVRENESLNALVKPAEEKDTPEGKIREIKQEIKVRVTVIRESGALDADITKEYMTELSDIVSRGLSPFIRALSPPKIGFTPDVHYWVYCNVSAPFPSSAFMRNSDVSYSGISESVAGNVVGRFQQNIASMFDRAASDNGLRINRQSLFDAIDNLHIGKDCVIVAFGVYWDFYFSAKQAGLVRTDAGELVYKETRIINLPSYSSKINQTVFVLREADLPYLTFESTPRVQIEQYKIKQLNEEVKLYASLVQLSQDASLTEIARTNHPNEELRDKTLFSAFMTARVAWSKFMPMFKIKLMYSLDDNGSLDDITSITPFDVFSRNVRLLAQRAEAIAFYEVERELGIKIERNYTMRWFDGFGKIGDKTYFVEVKYTSSGRLVGLLRTLEQLRRVPQAEQDVLILAIVSKNPMDEKNRNRIESQVLTIDSKIELRFYSFYR